VLYQGGLAVWRCSVAVIAATVTPGASVGCSTSGRPLGRHRSYSIYSCTGRSSPDLARSRRPARCPTTLIIRLVLTAVAAEISYRFVEMPIRRGSLGRGWTWLLATQSTASTRARRWSAAPVAGALAAVLSVLLVSVAIATPPPPPPGMETASIDALVVDPEARPHDQPPSPRQTVVASPSATVAAHRPSDAPGATSATSPPTPGASPTPSPTPRRSILAFGESVMIQGAKAMARDLGPVRVDAAVGRHIGEGIEILERRAADGKLADTVIVQLGNNGPFRAGQFDAVMETLRDVRLVVWVNVRVPRDWEAHNNRIIASGIAKYPNARLVDWYGATEGRPDLFWKDGYHPRPEGAELSADLIAAATR
jgi:hypothetical protein